MDVHPLHHPHVTSPNNCTGHHRAVCLWPVAGAAFLQRCRLIVGICAPGRFGTQKWWVQRGSKPNKQRRWDFTWLHPSKMIIQQGNSEMSINENGTCWFHQNWMYWASGLQMRGTSASCLQKNAWCVVRMTDQWVLWSNPWEPLHNCHQMF